MTRCAMIHSGLVGILLLTTIAPAPARPAEPHAKATTKTKKKGQVSAPPKWVTAKKQRVRDVVKLKGVFLASEMRAIALTPRVWSDLKIVRIVPHGKRVIRGARLVTIDTKKIEQSIREAEIAATLAKLGAAQARQALEVQEKTVKLDLAAARRTKRDADEDLSRFLAVDRPQLEADARQSVKNAENALAYAREELRQLEKMYKADDLTEESEEIVLRRQRDTVKRLEWVVRRAKVDRDRTLQISIPRRQASLEEAVRRQSVNLDQALTTLPAGLNKARAERDKTQLAATQAGVRLQRLRLDRKALDVVAPIDGVVYYGQPTNGIWPAVNTLQAKLRPGGTLRPNDVFITVVKTPVASIGATVDEKELGKLRPGLRGAARPTGYPDVKLPVRLASLAPVPIAAGKFAGRLAIRGAVARSVMPGMTCSVELTVKDLAKVLAVPATAVSARGKEHFVYVPGAAGKPEKRRVTGRKIGTMFVIDKGVSPGTKVLARRPEATP